MLPWQRSPCTDYKFAKQYTTRGHPAPPTIPKLHPDMCSNAGMRRQTDRHTHIQTDGRDRNTFRLAIPNVKCSPPLINPIFSLWFPIFFLSCPIKFSQWGERTGNVITLIGLHHDDDIPVQYYEENIMTFLCNCPVGM